jgi:hypothetical protein
VPVREDVTLAEVVGEELDVTATLTEAPVLKLDVGLIEILGENDELPERDRLGDTVGDSDFEEPTETVTEAETVLVLERVPDALRVGDAGDTTKVDVAKTVIDDDVVANTDRLAL